MGNADCVLSDNSNRDYNISYPAIVINVQTFILKVTYEILSIEPNNSQRKW